MTLSRINSLNIRPSTEGDKQAIIEMWHRCGLFSRNSLDAENEFVVANLLPESKIFIAEYEDEVVAVVLSALSHTSGWIWDLAVDPTFQKRGIGKTMVRKAENWIKQSGGLKCMLFLQQDKEKSQLLHGFYSQLSYTNVTENIMQKSL